MTFIMKDDVYYECECRAVREAENILKRSGISIEFSKKTFDNFNFTYDYQISEAYRCACLYVNEFLDFEKTRANSIMFLGQVGSGKTHLSLAIANELMAKGIGVLYMPYRDAITTLKQNILDGEYYTREVEKYKRARVLLIDDLYKGNITKSDINIMFEIINHRYFNNKPVIISSEMNFNELLKIDESIESRLFEMSEGRVISLKGKELNYRHNKSKIEEID